jgi:single-strand DNA-binding protein
MAKSINRVQLLGFVGKDVEIKSSNGGTTIANLDLATNDRYKDQSGNWQDRTEWHHLVAFKKTAEIIRDYVKSGSKLHIDGKLQTRSWDDKDSGKKMYRTEIIVRDVILLSAKDGSKPSDGSEELAGDTDYADDEDSDIIPF